MSEQDTSWLDKIPLDAISIAVMVASMFLDGAYLRRFAYVGWFGLVCAYTLNCVADLAVNKLTREFVRQRLGNPGKWKRRLTWVLLLFAFASFYFTTVFSWREASLQIPDEPPWLLWSIASFAPTVLAGLGIAQALRDGSFTTRTSKTKSSTSETPAETQRAEPAVVLALPFQCQHCAAEFGTQAGLNAHQRVHKQERSNGHSKEPVVAGLEVN